MAWRTVYCSHVFLVFCSRHHAHSWSEDNSFNLHVGKDASGCHLRKNWRRFVAGVAKIRASLVLQVKFSEFKNQNIVGSCDVKFPNRLEGLAYSHGQFSSCEHEVGCRDICPLLLLTFSFLWSYIFTGWSSPRSCCLFSYLERLTGHR